MSLCEKKLLTILLDNQLCGASKFRSLPAEERRTPCNGQTGAERPFRGT